MASLGGCCCLGLLPFQQANDGRSDADTDTNNQYRDCNEASVTVEANKPFDLALESGLPRNEDGTFAGKEAEVAKLLRQVAKAWN